MEHQEERGQPEQLDQTEVKNSNDLVVTKGEEEKRHKAEIEALQLQLEEKGTELTVVIEKLALSEESCKNVSESLKRAQVRLSNLEGQLEMYEKELKSKGAEFDAALVSQCSLQEENQVLHSKLEAQNQQLSNLEAQIEQSEASRMRAEAALEDSRSQVSKLTETVSTLEHQVGAQRDSAQSSVKGAQVRNVEECKQGSNDAMSTSTISKADEPGRLHELDSCFEERYNKLKHLTIQFKKKAVEQEKLAKELKDKLAKASNDYSCLQNHCDEESDKLEETRKELRTVKQSLESSSSDFETLKQTLEDRERKLLTLQEEKDQLEISSKNLSLQMDEKSASVTTLMTTVEANAKEMDRLSKALKESEAELSNSTALSKQHDLLDMELESALKRVEELNSKIEEQEAELKTLRDTRDRLEGLSSDREALVKELEVAVERETQRHLDTKSKLDESRCEVSKLDVLCSELRAESSLLSSQLESVQREQIATSSRMSESNKSAMASKEALERKNESMSNMLKVLELELEQRRSEKEEMESKLNCMEKEFEAYRVRATSVLKRNEQLSSNSPSGNGSTLMHSQGTELAVLEQSVQDLNAKIAHLSCSLNSTETELSELQSEHDRLMQRHSSLLQELAAKELASRKKQEQLVALTNDAETARLQLAKQLEQTKCALKADLETRLEETKAAHTSLVNSLQRQLDEKDNQILRLQQQHQQHQQQQQQAATEAGTRPPAATPIVE